MKTSKSLLLLLLMVMSISAETVILRAGLNGFPGITDASARTRKENSGTFGTSYVQVASSFC